MKPIRIKFKDLGGIIKYITVWMWDTTAKYPVVHYKK